jgi:HK97 gp10 family phage protein
MNVKQEGESFEVWLNDINKFTDVAQEKILKESATIIKEKAVSELNRIRTNDTEEREQYKHMADDVRIVTGTNKYGGKIVKVQGGKTGTKWHLVNDGTYGGKGARHFIDNALNQTEFEIDNIIDRVLGGGFNG